MYLLRLEAGPEDDLLPALAPGDPHRQQAHRRGAAPRRPSPSRRPPTATPSPARSRTPRPARPASDHRHRHDRRPDAARPGHEPDAAADALPGVLRAVPRRDQEHLDRRGGRLLHRPRRPATQADRRPSGTWSAGWWRSSPPATRSSPTTWCSTSTSTSTRPRRGCTCRASCSRRRCTCSST